MKWYYTARSGSERCSGYIEANSLLLAKIKLKEQNIHYQKIKKVTWLFIIWSAFKKLYFRQIVKQQDKLDFIRQLAVLLSSGVPLLKSFDILSDKNHKHYNSYITNIKESLTIGDSVSNSFNKSGIFDPLLINLIDIGESTGLLHEMLDYYVLYQEKILHLKRKIKVALAYPITILVVSTTILMFMFILVIPQFQALFANSKIVLPPITTSLFAVSDFMRLYWTFVLVSLLVIFYLFRLCFNKNTTLRFLMARFLLKTPIIGNCIQQFNMIIFADTFALLYHAAMPINLSLNKINLVINNPVYRKHLHDVVDSIENGETLYDAVTKTGVFPKLVTATIHVGEESGELDSVLKKLAISIEQSLNSRLELLISLLEPITIVAVVSVLGAVLVALYLPLFHLGSIF